MILHTILCELCDEPIAKAHLLDLRRPLTGDMFASQGAGFDNPFLPGQTWEWMRCPHCGNRPFIVTDEQASDAVAGKWPGPEAVKTSKGVYKLHDKVFPGIPSALSASLQIHTEEELEAEWEARIKAGTLPAKEAPELDSKKAKRKDKKTRNKMEKIDERNDADSAPGEADAQAEGDSDTD